MRFSHWFDRTHQPAPSYRPGVEPLEDRTAPAGFRIFKAPPVLPATHLEVIAPSIVEPSQSFAVKVEALNANNQIVTGFRGTVQITLATPDSGATLPKSFTFSAADHGEHTFKAKLNATGEQMVDASSGALTGQACLTVQAANTQVYVPAYSFVYGYTYPFGVVAYPVVTSVVLMNPADFVTMNPVTGVPTNNSGLASTNPIDNISYGQNPFGTGVINNAYGIVVPPAVPASTGSRY